MTNTKDNNAELLDQVFRSDYQWLTAKLKSRLGCPDYAEDVASESFTRLAAIPTLPAIREPRAMLTTIAKRVVYDLNRRRALESAYLQALAVMPCACQPSAEEHYLLMEMLSLVDEALDGLPQKARRAFFYSQLDGLTYAQIGERLGVSVSRVRQYMAMALSRCYQVAKDRPHDRD